VSYSMSIRAKESPTVAEILKVVATPELRCTALPDGFPTDLWPTGVGVAAAEPGGGGAAARGGTPPRPAPAGESWCPARRRPRGRAAGVPGGQPAAALPLDGAGRAVTAAEGAPVCLPRGLQPARKHAPARQRQGALALERFEEAEDGRIAYRMKRPMPDGTTHLLFTGIELLRRLTSLVPPPRMNLTRFHGVFAPGAKLRPFLVPAAAVPGEQEALSAATAHQKRQRAPGLDWAGLLKRTFKVDVFSCPKCGGRRRVLAYLTKGAVLRRILRHLHLPELPPPLAPARGRPQQALWD
jgi:hypothetical protein